MVGHLALGDRTRFGGGISGEKDVVVARVKAPGVIRQGPDPGGQAAPQGFLWQGGVGDGAKQALAQGIWVAVEDAGGAGQAAAAARVSRLDAATGPTGALLALAATARHAIAGFNTRLPELIIGHGTLGRLLARLTVAAGGPPPVVWEVNPARRDGAVGYACIDPAVDPKRDYRTIYDASGAKDMLNTLVMRLAKGGEIVLAGFYTEPLNFAFPPAFMKEPRIRIAAEWQPDDLTATRVLIESGALSLDGLITHRRKAADAVAAYETAFDDPDCLKVILDWSATA